MHCSYTLSLTTNVTSSDATTCNISMQGETTDRGFCKARFPGDKVPRWFKRDDTIRQARALSPCGCYQGNIKEPSKGPRCYSVFFLGEGEAKRKGKGKIKGKGKVFILAYIVENHSHMDCEYGGVQGGRQQLDPHGMQMKTSR